MDQEIKFCTTSDDTSIAYSCVGSGPAFVKAANWMNHLELDWQSPVWRHLVEEFARDHTVVRYDERGTGLSERRVGELSLDAFVSDLESVVECAGIDRFPLFGISQGGPVAIEYAVRHPGRVSHLILLGTFATGWRRIPDLPDEILEKREAELTLIRQGWGEVNPAFRQFWTTLCIPDSTPAESVSFNELQRSSVSPDTAARIFEAIAEIDVADRLAKLDVPALVLHARNDALVSFNDGRRVAAAIKGARFVPLESNNHLILSHEPAWTVFRHEVRRFLGCGAEEATLPANENKCPTCGRRYGSDLYFCLQDGTRLETTTYDNPTVLL
jgi:pimeloyl-ACP methyl ester carboxylesterase